MGKQDPRIDAYLETVPDFARPILERVRKAFHRGCPEVEETMRWSRPSFSHHGILGSMSAFKAHVSWGFWRGKQLDDPEGLFEQVGDSEMCWHKVTRLADLPNLQTLTRYVKAAAALNADLATTNSPAKKQRKKKAAGKQARPRVPQDLATALAAAPEAMAFYSSLTAAQQREYVSWITEAKRDATRQRRLETTVTWLGEGKRRNWKYERC